MEAELKTYLQVWFGIREPEWDDYEDEEWEDKMILRKNSNRKPIKIIKKA